MPSAAQTGSPFQETILVGAGVVGTAIARAHLQATLPFTWLETDQQALLRAVNSFATPNPLLIGTSSASPIPGTFAYKFATAERLTCSPVVLPKSTLIIESIVERLDAKRELLQKVSAVFGAQGIFASNTSSLRIRDIAEQAPFPDGVCGMHFFMPVHQRFLTEIIATELTSACTLERVSLHAQALGKKPLIAKDSPGFVVNRMLWPYLNHSIAILGAGIDPQQLRAAAIRFGMPMSPLELIDWIGMRTAFDSGRIAWQAFPKRMEPSPILPGMLKAGLTGRTSGKGFYEYPNDTQNSNTPPKLSAEASKVIAKYQSTPVQWSDDVVYANLITPIWIEAALILKERLVENREQIEEALAGGLGLKHLDGFWNQIRRLNSQDIRWLIENQSSHFKALATPPELVAALIKATNPVDAIDAWLN